MSKFFYQRLALINIKNNYRTYIPYILTCIGTVMMYYIIFALSIDNGLASMYGGAMTQTLLMLGTWVIALFAIIFLIYTNSFLMKRRKKEFGLFNILGMEKKHIAKIIFYETIFVAVLSLVLGILCGILFSKLSLLILVNLLDFEIYFGFTLSYRAIIATLALFGVIYAVILLNNLRQIHLSKPVELLRGGQVGEKEPKTKWLTSIIGFICLGVAYYLALTSKMSGETLIIFLFAVCLVIIGTHYVFTAGSILILKTLRKNKGYFYKTKHFISVSGMIYRMKQNAAGLANICILSTMVLVMLSSTVCLYIGMDDNIRSRYPRNISINLLQYSEESIDTVEKLIDKNLNKHNVEAINNLKYRYAYFNVDIEQNIAKLTNQYNPEKTNVVYLIPLDDYNALLSKVSDNTIDLDNDEVLIYSTREKFNYDSINLLGNEYKIKNHIDSFDFNNDSAAFSLFNCHYIITKDIENLNNKYNEEAKSVYNRNNERMLYYYIAFDLEVDNNIQLSFYNDLYNDFVNEIREDNFTYDISSSAEGTKDFKSLYGGLFFLGIFLGLVFIMATVLIMYYKQISEGYDDKERFEIMQKVGMSHSEIKSSIRSQVLTVFFLPLVTAGIHIAFAFPIITKMLQMINLTNVNLFAICTVASLLIFTIFYAIVYALTARTYYRIVK